MTIITKEEITGSLSFNDKDKECLKRAGVILELIAKELDRECNFDYVELINKRNETLPELMYAFVHDTQGVFNDILELWNGKNR
jgi:hypothetical protein